MYSIRTELNVAPGASDEAEAFVARLGELRKKAEGGIGQTLLRSYGRPNVYTIMGRYETPEAAWAFGESSAMKDLVKSLPAGMLTQPAPQRGYVNVLEVDAEGLTPGDAGQFNCEVLVDWSIDLPKNREFVESRRQLFELRKKHDKGFGSNRLRRNAGTPTDYLIILIQKDYESLMSAEPAKEVMEFALSHTSELYGHVQPHGEAYHVVHRI